MAQSPQPELNANGRMPRLDAALERGLDELMAASGDAMDAGDGAASIDMMETAWGLLPEPKHRWDFYPQTISRGVVETLFDCGRCDVLDRWLERMYETHWDVKRADTYTNLIAGHALYECGREDEAFELFKRAFDKDGSAYFLGPYKPYLHLVRPKKRSRS